MKPNRACVCLALALLLASCTPQVTPPTPPPPPVDSGTVLQNNTNYYPYGTGMKWAYLPEGEPASAPPYVLEVVGPTVFRGKGVTAMHFYGRAADQVYFRDISKEGVKLLGILYRETGELTFDPPWLEYPPESVLKVGGYWADETTVSEPPRNGKSRQYKLRYSYRVLSTEQFKIGDKTYDVLRINLDVQTTDGQRSNQTIRFAPKIGEISTKEGLNLIGRNF